MPSNYLQNQCVRCNLCKNIGNVSDVIECSEAKGIARVLLEIEKKKKKKKDLIPQIKLQRLTRKVKCKLIIDCNFTILKIRNIAMFIHRYFLFIPQAHLKEF